MSTILKRILITLPYTIPVFVASFTTIAIAFLIADLFVTTYVVIVGVIVSFLLSYFAYKHVARDIEVTKSNMLWTSLVVFFCGLWFVGNAHFTSQHIFVDRDPGIYSTAAIWLTEHESLRIEKDNQVFDSDIVQSEGSAYKQSLNNENELAVQGAHALPALLSLVGRVVGIEGMLHIIPLFGAIALLAFYGFLRVFVKKKLWSILGMVLLSVSLPMIYFSRDTYSEPLALIFVFGGLSMLFFAQKTNHYMIWLAAGVVAGAGALTRIDSLLAIAGMLGAVFLVVARADEKARRRTFVGVTIFILAAAALFGLSYLDLAILSSNYLQEHIHLIKMQLIVVVSILIIGYLYNGLPHTAKIINQFFSRNRKLFMVITAYASGAIGLILLSRPLWFIGMEGREILHVKLIQLASGMEQNGFRNYAENSLEWMMWYIGALTVFLALIGLVLIIMKIFTSRNIIYVAFIGVVGGAALIYLNIPSITADQIWASRRFLPVVIPGLIALAVYVLASVETNKGRAPKTLQKHITVILLGVMAGCIIGAASTTLPFAKARTYDGQVAQVKEVCDTLPKNSALLLTGGYSYIAVPTFRAVCGDIEVGFIPDDKKISNEIIAAINNSVRSTGRELYMGVLRYNIGLVAANGITQPFNSSISMEYEYTLTKPPETLKPTVLDFYLASVDENGYMHAVRR